jgi:hypothetical protein
VRSIAAQGKPDCARLIGLTGGTDVGQRERLLMILWGLVLLEIVSPIPMALTVGAIWVLIARPPWFLQMVQRLYRD